MSIADLYIRVSTDEQAIKGFSQRSQEERLRKYCVLNQIDIRKSVVEDHSAKSFDRPAWNDLIKEWDRYKKRRPNFVLFTQWDRFSRNVGYAYYMIVKLKHLGIEPRAIEQPINLAIPENKVMLALYLASSEVENDRRALNVKQGLRRARQEGRWPCPAPKGYLNITLATGQKCIIIHEPEATAIRKVFSMLAEAKYSLSYIYKYANTIGLKCSESHFKKMIQNPLYCGKVKVSAFEKEKEYLVDGIHEKIISQHQFNKVQNIILSKAKKVFTKVYPKENLPLRGFLLCPLCNKTLTGSASQGHAKRYFYYHCSRGCRFRTRADKVNTEFLDALSQLSPLPIYSEIFNLILQNTYFELFEKKTMDQAHTIKAMEQLIDRVVRAREALYSGAIDSEDFVAIKDNCEKRINTLCIQLQELTTLKLTKTDHLKRLSKSICEMARLYDKADLILKRQIVALMFSHSTIYKEQIKSMFDPALKIIFNIDSCIHNEITITDETFVVDDEQDSTTKFENLLITRLKSEQNRGVDANLIRQILLKLKELAVLCLNTNLNTL